jgi:hypothetical protein
VCRSIVDRGHQGAHSGVVASDLKGNRALTRCRRNDLRLEPLGNAVTEPKPIQPRAREDEGVGLAGVEPADTRVHIAMERMDHEIWSPGEQEPGASRAVRPDTRARQQVGEPSLGRVRTNYQCVARIGPRQVGANVKTWMLVGRHVLCAVYREVDAAVEQRALDRGDEGSLAPLGIR